MRSKREEPRRPRSREELLAHIKQRGRHLRARRRVVVGSPVAVVLVVAVVVPLLWATGRSGDVDVEVGTTADTASTTSTSRRETTTTSSAPTTSTTATTAVDEGGGTTTTTSTRRCRNSYDGACGPFYWDPEPASSELSVDVSMEPAAPRVGDQVVFIVEIVNPDTPNFAAILTDAGDGNPLTQQEGMVGCTAEQRPRRYGPWTPPERQTGSRLERWSYTYNTPGTYQARLTYRSGFCHPDWTPYRGTGEGTITFTVQPA